MAEEAKKGGESGMTEQLKAKLKAINAVAVGYDTGEKWVDEDGTKYNIERKPIDWEAIKQSGEAKQL